MKGVVVQIMPWPGAELWIRPACFLCRALIDDAPVVALLCEPGKDGSRPRPWAMICPRCGDLGAALEPALRKALAEIASTSAGLHASGRSETSRQRMQEAARHFSDLAAGPIRIELPGPGGP